jgi:uncharacterized protein
MSGAMKIVLAGGSGQVGTMLAGHFHGHGHQVVVLSRSTGSAPWRVIPWDGATLGIWIAELRGADVLINLAGRSVDCRYTAANRKEILSSRINSTRLLGEAIATLDRPPRLWMNASTATIYRHALDRPMDEESGELGGNEPDAPGTWRFSIEVAISWEHAFFVAPTPFTRKIALRSAMVMSPDRDGVFDVLLRLVRYGLGGKAGSGRQYVSWVHEADFIRALEYLIEHEEFEGPVNIASPNPLPNSEFMRQLRRAWGTRIGLAAPKPILELGAWFLRTETELILKSRRVVPQRLLESGFEFQFPEWQGAASNLVDRWRKAKGRYCAEVLRGATSN